MKDENDKSTSQDAGQTGEKASSKKFLGKFDTAEEAIEQGIGGLEKGFTETRQQVSRLEGMVGELVTTLKGLGSGGDVSGSDYGRSNTGGGKDELDKFVADPLGFLNAQRQRDKQEMVGAVSVIVQNAIALTDWKRENSDLIPHEPIVSHFMKETDPKKPPVERLNEAGAKARKYIAQMRGKQSESPRGNVNAQDYVENPTGAGNIAGAGGKGTEEEDESLSDYISGRSKARAEAFGVKSS